MALTRDSNETFRARVQRDPGFREALLREGIENFLSGDVETGKIISVKFGLGVPPHAQSALNCLSLTPPVARRSDV